MRGGYLTVLDFLFAGLALYLLYKLLSGKKRAYPPGPRGLPILQNLVDFPAQQEWKTFAKWGQQFGDIVSVSIFGQRMIILNSAQLAMDMLDKKSSIYSDRPIMQMGGELVGWKHTLVLLPYGNRFRNYRKMFHQVIGTPAAMATFNPIEEEETHKSLRRVLKSPEDLAAHVRKTAGAIILRISHGYEVKEQEDPFVTLADRATEQFSLSTAPGFLVNLVPALQHLPSWSPGGGFHKTAAQWRETLDEMVQSPHQFVKDQMAAGTAESSFTSRLLEEKDVVDAEEHDIKWSAASLYSGGADTTVSATYAFFLAMVLHPEVAHKAQQEIDEVVGHDRLPNYGDRPNLPYTNAVALEVSRWHSVVPTGVPHRVTEDDLHNGYFIPKGSLVIANVWYMLHDPRVYSDPFKFDPERFLGPTPEPDPRDICFGFGRRICPGRVLADVSVYMTAAMSLSVFDISKAKTREGRDMEVTHEQTTGTISHPKPFQCSIKPRSARAISLISSDTKPISWRLRYEN